MNITDKYLDSVAVDKKTLSTNYADVVPDCTGVGADIKTELMNRYPLVTWLLNTALTRQVRAAVRGDNGHCAMHKDGEGKWVIEVPRSIWTELPVSTETECCWQPFDFAKCAGNVPLNLLCLKDCDSITDELVYGNLPVGATVPGLSGARENIAAVNRRIARLSMAFLTAQNIILGRDNTYTDVLKPFHGLLAVMENPAVATIYGAHVLSAFDSVACRLALLGGTADSYVYAMNPLVYQTLLTYIRPGQYGDLPFGWTRNGDEIRFRGSAIIQDRMVPVDLNDGTGEVWLLSSDAVGAYMMTDLMPADAFIKQSGHQAGTIEQGCGSDCTYYYNLGTTFNNNANKVMRIVDVPFSGVCAAAISDLGGLIMPQTLIPEA